MRQAAMLHCSSCDKDRFTGMKRHGNLPFAADDSAGWREYSLGDAFALRLQLDLMGVDGSADSMSGLPAGAASAMIRETLSNVDLGRFNTLDGPALWLGVMGYQEPVVNLGDTPLRFDFAYAGALADVAGRSLGGSLAKPFRVFLVNATSAMRFVYDRARDMGFAEADYIDGIFPPDMVSASAGR